MMEFQGRETSRSWGAKAGQGDETDVARTHRQSARQRVVPARVEVPPTRAGRLAAELVAANRFRVLQTLHEPVMMVRVGAAVGERLHLTADGLSSLERAGRRALAAAAIVPCGLPAAVTNEMAEFCRVGGRLIQLSALLRRARVVSAGERVQLRAMAADVADALTRRIGRLQAGLPGEREDFEARCRSIEEQTAPALEAFAMVQRWLAAERYDAAYSALGGTIGDRDVAEPRLPTLEMTDMTHRVARRVLVLSANESFDEALQAVVREIDALAPTVVACASAPYGAPLIRCRNSLDALAVFTRSALGAPSPRFDSAPSLAAQR